jgi:hypothetical protein
MNSRSPCPSRCGSTAGRKRVHGADEIMAQITAERLIEHLERSGYVVMCKPGLASHSVGLGDAIEKAVKTNRGE